MNFLARVLQALQDGNLVNIDEANPGESDMTALQYAEFLGRLDIIQALLHSGANVNVTDSDAETLLYIAAHGGNLEVVTLLLRVKGINIHVKLNTGSQYNTAYKIAELEKDLAKSKKDATAQKKFQTIINALTVASTN